MQGFKSIEYPSHEYTIKSWDAWIKWMGDEIDTYGCERRIMSQEEFCPVCGGEAAQYHQIERRPRCYICSKPGHSCFNVFFKTRCPVGE